MVAELYLEEWTRINRNIVECKSLYQQGYNQHHLRINRNIVECKFNRIVPSTIVSPELIETLWNVNKILSVTPAG